MIPGGTQTFAVETEGWSWYAGGGFEGWVTPRFALYTEVVSTRLRGPAKSGSDLELTQRVTSVVAGVRLKLF